MPQYLLAIDQGTTSTRAIVYRADPIKVASGEWRVASEDKEGHSPAASSSSLATCHSPLATTGDPFTELASASCELQQHYPRPGWVEHDPEKIWSTVADVVPPPLPRPR